MPATLQYRTLSPAVGQADQELGDAWILRTAAKYAVRTSSAGWRRMRSLLQPLREYVSNARNRDLFDLLLSGQGQTPIDTPQELRVMMENLIRAARLPE